MTEREWDIDKLRECFPRDGAHSRIMRFVGSRPLTTGLEDIVTYMKPMHPDTTTDFVHRLAKWKLFGTNREGYYLTEPGARALRGLR